VSRTDAVLASSDDDADAVFSVDCLQQKSRWLPDVPGYCPSGFRTRGRLRAKCRKWQGREEKISHITLTYDAWPWMESGKPSGWDQWDAAAKRAFYASPVWQAGCRRAFDDSRRRRHVAEFQRRVRAELGAGTGELEWFRVVEFQENGMPHFHLLINREWIDHAMLMRAWGKGFVLIRPCVDETAGYVTKYITKGVDAPPWLLGYVAGLRMTSASRGIWDEVGGRRSRSDLDPDREVEHRGPGRSIAEIRADPRRHTRCMWRIILATGEEMYRSVKINLCTSMNTLSALGLNPVLTSGGAVKGGDLGQASFRVVGSAVLLDQLLHCVSSAVPAVESG
jgi:hypothetical protein